MTREEIERLTWDFLRSKGLSEYSTSAVMGNIESESEFNPSLVEQGNSIGFGLCQWSFERRTQLESYGIDLSHQLNFLWAELSGEIGETGANFQWINKRGYLSHVDFMDGNGELNEMTSAFCFCWERPNVALAHLSRRQNSANTYYATFTGTTPTTPVNPPPYTPVDPPNNPANPSEVKLKNNYLYGSQDKIFGRKFVSPRKVFTLVESVGTMSIIQDGEIKRKVPRKNIIN